MGPFVLLALLTAPSALAAEARVLRHAVLVGVNDGGGDLEPLRHAEADARRIQEVLTELGGFAPAQVTVLQDPDRDQLQAALLDHSRRGQDTEDLFFFYYSGHADARGLRLGQELVPYTELRQSIRDMPSEVRLGVLDACRSGEITRIKGLAVSDPFATEVGLGAAGEAWLTATSADEAAQESDRIGGGFFTHYLVSGLRGAADIGGAGSGDGIVSLGEAYAYAYDRTVARTGATDAGTQHPGYDFRLQGQGDLPLTDVSQASARVRLPKGMEGELTVLRLPGMTPIAEVAKDASTEVILALPPGRYLLRLRNEAGMAEGTIGLGEGSDLELRDFVVAPVEVASAKGGEEVHAAPPLAIPADPLAIEAPVEAQPEPAPAVVAAAPTEESTTFPGHRIAAWGERTSANIVRWTAARAADLERAVDPPGAGEVDADRVAPLDTDWSAGRTLLPQQSCGLGGPRCLEALIAGGTLPEGPLALTTPDGEPLALGEARDGSPQGAWTFTLPDGRKQAEGSYLEGKRSGTWTWWQDDGLKRERGSYIGGRRTGQWTEWYANGKRKTRTLFSDDSPAGRHTEWYEDGTRKAEGEVLGDQRVGRWVFWYDTGRKRAQGDYAGGERTGRWTTWHPTGGRSSRGGYVGGQKHGDWQYWWEEAGLASEGAYDHDEKVGRWTEWHPSGGRSAKGSYARGRKVGKWSTWTETGERSVERHPR